MRAAVCAVLRSVACQCLRHHSVNDLVGIAADILRRLERAADTGDDDRVIASGGRQLAAPPAAGVPAASASASRAVSSVVSALELALARERFALLRVTQQR
jgi:hypothetical protein